MLTFQRTSRNKLMEQTGQTGNLWPVCVMLQKLQLLFCDVLILCDEVIAFEIMFMLTMEDNTIKELMGIVVLKNIFK